ncbi:MAG: rhamnogalacturonan lyase [Sedimentisphaerales bacterium]|nr:rhamnogalacturonan lyase [Sedimentisphaerales bacterium]
MSRKFAVIAFLFFVIFFNAAGREQVQYQMEKLGRGLIAVDMPDGGVYVGWRILGTDPNNIAFNVYRDGTLVNSKPITQSTNLIDANGTGNSVYTVKAFINGSIGEASPPAKVWSHNYLSIPLQTPEGYRPNDASLGDIDGDGEYEIVLKQEKRPRDNARSGTTGQTKLEAYKLDGTFLWRIDLGKNIREGAHYTQFIVYDLDGDGKAEVACKTADGTIDGKGKVIGDPNADYRNDSGFVLAGPEFLTIFDGLTGAALATVDYIPPRGGDGSGWGDSSGNRVDRFLACVAYLDGQRPSLVMCRGYYTRTVLAAWNYRDKKLSHLWTFDSEDGTPGNSDYSGQGNHNLSVSDIDGDGKDEIVYGACAIDDNGKGLYSAGLGHGDAMHLSDIDPDKPGMEVFGIHERPSHPYAANLRDAATGKVIWGMSSEDVGRGLSMDIDPRYRGYECWASLDCDHDGLYNCKGEKISESKPSSCRMGIWWDSDVLRELLDGTTITKWDYANNRTVRLFSADGCRSNNSSKANPCLCADILGDWREEVIFRTSDNKYLRIYTTTISTERRFYTFMHDRQYRLSIAWQNVGYNQPAHTSFYVGEGMKEPPRPLIKTTIAK